MRCGLRWDRITRIARYALLPIVLTSVDPTAAFAQLVCYQIRPNESAAQVARRMTGDGRNAYQAWFQILNASSRSIPKSQYDRIRAGWRACVAKPAFRIESKALPVKAPGLVDASASPERLGREAHATRAALALPTALPATQAFHEAAGRTPPIASRLVRAIRGADLIVVWLSAALVVPWFFGWRLLDEYLGRRKTESIVMRYFADRFVLEFERPLVRYTTDEHPLKSRVRNRLRPGRFDILLAPGEGRRYPNLSDHKKNVEYDVARVVRVLGDQSFVSGPLYTRAGWVVVPFRFKAGPKQAGVTCISSL
jgi:hypothetical protein